MIPNDRKIYGRFVGQPISAHDLLFDLPVKNKRRLRTLRREIEVCGGEAVSDRDDFPETIYILQSGKAELSFTNQLNDKVYRREIEKEEIIGLRRLILHAAGQKKVTALSRCQFVTFPAREFYEVLQHDAILGYRLLEILSLEITKNYRDFAAARF
jgi:CRP-like cAMP-binding protein